MEALSRVPAVGGLVLTMVWTVGLYVDYENVRQSGIKAFPGVAPHPRGEVSLLRLARQIASDVRHQRRVAREEPIDEQISIEVHAYRGLFDDREPRGEEESVTSAHKIKVIWEHRPIVQLWGTEAYDSRESSEGKDSEKGIDVAMALQFVISVKEQKFNANMLFSIDRDVLESVYYLDRIAGVNHDWRSAVQLCTWFPIPPPDGWRAKNILDDVYKDNELQGKPRTFPVGVYKSSLE